MAADQEGRVWVWGRNADGELGLGDFVRRSEPTVVTRLLPHWISKVNHDNVFSNFFVTNHHRLGGLRLSLLIRNHKSWEFI
jgi:hypothetical protein